VPSEYVISGSGYRSAAVLVNPSDSPQILELRLIGSGSGSSVFLEVPPRRGAALDIGGLFGTVADMGVRGAVEVRVTRGAGVLGSVWIRSEDHRIMAGLPLVPPSGTAGFIFPQLAQAQGYWTGLSLANGGASAVSVTVEAFDSEGTSLGREVRDLAGGACRIGLLDEWIRNTLGVPSGRVEVRSTGPIWAAEIFGADTLSFMAAVPGR
jgi:hypothetical protein